MINFLRISNNIELGNYLHSNGTIDNIPSPDIIGVCVIPSNFFPDRYSRFMTLERNFSQWGPEDKVLGENHLEGLPSEGHRCSVSWGTLPTLISPYLPDNTFNPKFHKELRVGNAFQDYKGYENTQTYRKKVRNNPRITTSFDICFDISPSYKKLEWYLPAIGELALLYEKKSIINVEMNKAFAVGSNGVSFLEGYCWSSSERSSFEAWIFCMLDGFIGSFYKRNLCQVRAFLAL